MRKNHGDEESKARDLFYALWISDIFMERVKNNEKWSLFCPDKCKGLTNSYGDDYKKLYLSYERDPENIVKQLPTLIEKKIDLFSSKVNQDLNGI